MSSAEGELIWRFRRVKGEVEEAAKEAWLEAFVLVLNSGNKVFLSWAAFHYEEIAYLRSEVKQRAWPLLDVTLSQLSLRLPYDRRVLTSK